ncbi:MAG: diacylglycerol kinase family lipid kinase [Candidatus Aminicenantes bacterium]|nr:diacylglycerol kinase family lipid kinase [Candidatus Aminicenantes bacterium]
MNKVHVIVNPYSARGQTEKKWGSIQSAIKAHFREFKYVFTEKPRQATEIARSLIRDGFDLIIGVGGDGTLNEISNGFFGETSGKTINQDAALGIIPSGTGSDFIRFMKIPREFEKSAAMIKNSKNKKIDIGKITYGGAGAREQYFINVADFGLGAEVIKRIANVQSVQRGALTYYRGLLATLMNYRSKTVTLTVDGQQQLRGEYLIGAIANGRIFGGGMIIAPQAEPNDGFFDLVLIGDMKKLEIIRNTRLLYTGTIAKNPKVVILKARNIKVESQEDVFTEYDGEMGEKLPAEFSIVARALNFRIG